MGSIPQLDIHGEARECGRQLGHAWREALALSAQQKREASKPWWKARSLSRLIGRLAPHLPDVYLGMAEAAELNEDLVGTRAMDGAGGCTTFAISPRLTASGEPICGQSKDTPPDRLSRYQVLALRVRGAPAMLSLTYPGWLFGHGLVVGRCSLFRNSLFAGEGSGRLSFVAWGLLAMHSPSVEEAGELAQRFGVAGGFHAGLTDAKGGIGGVESTAGGVRLLKAQRGIYIHANAVRGHRPAVGEDSRHHYVASSERREQRLRELLEPNRGRLTPQLIYAAMSDHEGFPDSICRHEYKGESTTACVIAEPAQGAMLITKGPPCASWPTAYRL